jgi:hypothetical protein
MGQASNTIVMIIDILTGACTNIHVLSGAKTEQSL